MEQRDFLLRQIQLMAQALVALIRKLTGLKEESSESEEALEQASNEMLTQHFELELSDILKVPLPEFIEWMVERRGIHISNLELFAEVLILNAGVRSHAGEKQQLLQAALALLSYVDQQGNTFSMDRHSKIKDLRRQIETGGYGPDI